MPNLAVAPLDVGFRYGINLKMVKQQQKVRITSILDAY
jgi:hypothetical protein